MLSERENYYSTKIFEEFNKFYQSELLPIHKFESPGFVEILSIFRVTCSLDTACGIYKDFFTHPIEFLDLGFSKMIQWFILKNILVQQHKVELLFKIGKGQIFFIKSLVCIFHVPTSYWRPW